MKVVKPVDGRVAAERRLAQQMLWLEHGGVSHGLDLVPLPAPHEPYPLIKLPPQTARGLAATIHYRPTVGVVYYTASEGFAVRPFVESISALLAAAGEAHLKDRPRTVAASPSAVLRHRGRVRGGHLLVGPRKCYRKPEKVKGRGDYPARLLMWTPPSELEPPPHYSVRAAFTWVFMPVTAALAIGTGPFWSMAALNATIAAVFYDGGLLCRHPDGATLERLKLAEFGFPRPPAAVAAEGGPAAAGGSRTGALLLTAEGAGGRRLVFVGQHLCLRAPPRSPAGCPLVAFDPEGLLCRGPAPQCWACDAPVGGEALVVHAPRAPPAGAHRHWCFPALPAGAPLLPEEAAGKGLLLCLHCWGALDSPACLTEHMQARVSRTVVPLSQAEACAACPGYAGIAPLLEGLAAPVPGVPGAFSVDVGGEAVVLAGERLGAYPALTVPELAALRLPIIAGLRLAEERGAHIA